MSGGRRRAAADLPKASCSSREAPCPSSSATPSAQSTDAASMRADEPLGALHQQHAAAGGSHAGAARSLADAASMHARLHARPHSPRVTHGARGHEGAHGGQRLGRGMPRASQKQSIQHLAAQAPRRGCEVDGCLSLRVELQARRRSRTCELVARHRMGALRMELERRGGANFNLRIN